MMKQTLWAMCALLPLTAAAQTMVPQPSEPPAETAAPVPEPALGMPSLYLSTMFSFNLPDYDLPTGVGYGGHLVVGLPINDWLSLELNGYGYALEAGTGFTGWGSQWGMGVDARMMVFQTANFGIFGIGGIGGGYMDLAPILGESYYPTANLGAGVLVSFTQNLALRAEARYNPLLTSDGDTFPGRGTLHDSHYNVGLEYSFGRAAQEPVMPPPAPEPVKVVGLDQDGDGVPDAADKCPGTPAGTAVDAAGCALPPPPPAPVDSDGDGVNDDLDKCPNTAKGLKVDATGCVVQQVLVLQSINYATGSGALLADSKTILDRLAETMKAQPDLMIEIIGHTDASGSDAANLKLSKARAAMVKEYLITQGVAADHLSADGKGESEPIADNKTVEGRAQNRRVEFKIKK